MTDSYGRTLEYLRLSLTPKCNFSCLYCNPKKAGQGNLGCDRLCEGVLSVEEYRHIVRIFSELGIKKIRLTGGEPLLFDGIFEIVEEIKSCGIDEIALTTNGYFFLRYGEKLKAAGLTAVNFSLDAIDEDVFEKIAGVRESKKVQEAILFAKKIGLRTKINAVIIKGVNDSQIEKLADFALENKTELRFIELMPLGFGKTLSGVRTGEIQEILKNHFDGKFKFDEENSLAVPGFYPGKNPGKILQNCSQIDDIIEENLIKFITPVSHRFCKDCNRLRITSDGKLKLCLAFSDGIDLKKYFDRSDEEIKSEILRIAKLKPKEHNFNGESSDSKSEDKLMQQIGG